MLLLIGPTRAGKSKLMANLSKDAINNGECVIVFDFIKSVSYQMRLPPASR